jgi:hypothetical protein
MNFPHRNILPRGFIVPYHSFVDVFLIGTTKWLNKKLGTEFQETLQIRPPDIWQLVYYI